MKKTIPKPPEPINLQQLFAKPAEVIADLVTIDINNLEEDMVNHPRLVAWATVTYENTRALAEAAKWDVEYMTSQAYHELFAKEGMSIGKAEKLVGSDIKVTNQQKKHQALRRQVVVLRALVTALDHRKDMIVQIAARQRQEISSYNA